MGFAEFMERALYDPEHGFYESGQAGRRGGHFITSPEVGPLFGAVVGRMLDHRWDDLGRPDPFTVVDAGAGPGTLARTVAKAEPHCMPALRWINVERSAAGRSSHTVGQSARAMPEGPITGVIVANELLDNLPLRLFDTNGREVGEDPASPDARLTPRQDQACTWLAQALSFLDRGTVVVIDYMSTTEKMATRPWPEWLRTYRGHERGEDPWTAPGSQDITCEVALDQLAAMCPPTRVNSQAEWLRVHGIDELVDEGAAAWRAGAVRGDLAALTGRSRTIEAEALLDPAGLGGFTVAEWDVPVPQGD
ncbi:MAG: SAM-dependent methyltransferase [Acidimicrobiia bacterium]|nr:SAM-dependent methyltransferase [Acidimicrobiia bacterium]MCY4433100.1 SAM-dependent methyltransferase [bacterium]